MKAAGEIGANSQLLAMLELRWRMIRSRPLRVAITAITVLPVVLIIAGLMGMQPLPDEQTFRLSLATPTFYVGFVVLAVLAPLVSGGGYELYPAGQLVGYNVKPAAVFRGTLVLAPVNLAWAINVVALLIITGFSTGDIALGPTSRALLTVSAFIGAVTIAGHTIGWLVMGIRQSYAGRLATNIAGALVIFAALLVFWTDNVIPLLDNAPTRYVLVGAFDGYQGDYVNWLRVVGVLVLAGAILLRAGDAITGWALRRTGDHADRTSSRSLPRRRWSSSVFFTLLAVDHASIWRSTPLRRGVLVLVVVPGVVSAFAGMTWQSLILVPGLIAAGAGLLFGINAFTLDSTGAVWLSTLPGWASPAYLSKSLVFFEVAMGAVLSAFIGGSLRAQPPNAISEITAAMMSALCCAALVVALGMRSSLRNPHRADLQGPRDTPATPGVMAAQSLRFALVTTFTSLFFLMLAYSGAWWLPLLGAVPVLLLSALHWYRTGLAWAHPHVRASVVATVSGG
ncbi:MAG: hypothetical protein LH630_10610 [Actinomycetia bacterium]|nr:hypothetical protein [Actinomycetes bacterium]